MHKLLVERTSFKNLLRGSEPGRIDRGRHDVNARSIRVQSMDGQEAWTFNYKSNPSTTGHRWHGYVRFMKEDVSNKDNAMDLDCMVDCDCPDYRYRFAYNNAKADVGTIGRQNDWRHANQNNGRPPRPRSQGGVGDYGVGMCKHLCSLAEFLKTKITSDAPEPEEEEPTVKPTAVLKKAPKITPEHPTTTDAPEPGDSYSDSRSGLNEGRGRLYEQIDSFVRGNPEFDVQVIDNSLNENTVVVSESHEHGEWWIDEYGGVEFADGDTGDYNHEAIVIQRLNYQILSNFGIENEEGTLSTSEEDLKRALKSDGRLTPDEEASWDNMAGSKQKGPSDIIIEKLVEDKAIGDKKQTEDAVYIAYGSSTRDARNYAMQYWGWKVMKTFNKYIEIQTWVLKPDDLSIIVKGIWEIMDNDTDRDEDEDSEVGPDGFPGPFINVTVQAQGKRYSNIPLCVMEKKMPAQINAYRSGVHVGYTENLKEDYHHHHKEYRMYEANRHIIAIFEDNTRLKFEVHFRNKHGEDRDKWRRRAFTTWKSLASKLHGDVTLSDACNPIQKPWKDCFKEALKDPKLKEFIRSNPHHKIFDDAGYPAEVQGKAQPVVDPVNFTPRQ